MPDAMRSISSIETISSATLLRQLSIVLDDPIDDLALRDAEDDQNPQPVEARHYFQVVKGVLLHVLGRDSAFPEDELSDHESRQDLKVAQLYQSPLTRTLIARVLSCSEDEVTLLMTHQFFVRIAWLNDAALTSEKAQSQLNFYIYGFTPFWDQDIELGEGAYSELRDLLAPVPQELQAWMVRFKRGLRLATAAEWFTLAPASALYQGLATEERAEQDPEQDDVPSDSLSIFASVVSRLLPTHGDYHDEALMHSLTEQLDPPAAWVSIVHYLRAIPAQAIVGERLFVDTSTPLSTATRCDFFRRIAAYVLNPDNEPWLDQAIEQAKKAPGMRALSLANLLCGKHPQLTPELALRIASLMLMPLEPAALQSAESLPHSQALSAEVPRLDQWCATLEVDSLFQRLGINLLCQQDGGRQVLRLSPCETWQALMQTAQFKSLFAPMLARMNWYGADEDEQSSPLITQALAGRAIVDYFLAPTDSGVESIETFYFSSRVTEYSHNELLDQVRQRINTRQPDASPSVISLLEYLLLREMAPELLIQGVPDSLWYGRSLQSVSFLHGVAQLEALSSGAAQRNGFDDVVATSAQMTASDDPGIHALWAKTQVLPALRYAIAHGAIEWAVDADIRDATAGQITQALSFLTAQQDLHAQELNALLSLKSPDREFIARHQLAEAGVNPSIWLGAPKDEYIFDYLDGLGIVRAASFSWDRITASGVLGRQATVLELLMMGELYVENQPTVPQQYEQAFTSFRQAMDHAEAAIIQRLLGEMPSAQRTVLAASTGEVSRFKFDEGEGNQGIFIRCQSDDHRHDFHAHAAAEETFFEVIPAAGIARQIPQRFNYVVPEPDYTWDVVMNGVREDHYHRDLATARITPVLPVDSDAYLTGMASRSTADFNHPLSGVLVPSATLVFSAGGSEKTALDAIAVVAAEHLLGATLDAMKTDHLHETAWEKIWAKERKIADFAARLIIPFYGCIKDLSAGDTSAGVVIGCTLDIAFALIPMGQFVGATTRVILRAGELTVLSIGKEMTAAIGRLTLGLAEQSALFLIRDVSKLVLRLSRLAWTQLFEHLPALRKIFSGEASLAHAATLEGGKYRLPHSPEPAANVDAYHPDTQATVDGVTDVAVRNVGTPDAVQFRLLDPYTQNAFGPALTPLASSESLELSTLSAADSLMPGHYPAVLPVSVAEDGVHEVRIAQDCVTHVIQRDAGVFDIIVDGHPYRLDTTAAEPVLRKLAVTRLSTEASRLEEIASLCRPVRDLVPGPPCPDFVKLLLPAISIPLDEAATPLTLGQQASAAFSAREYQLARVQLPGATVDLMVHEGKVCKWDHALTPGRGKEPARLSAEKKLVALTSDDTAALALSDTPVYRDTINGRFSTQQRMGFPESVEDADAAQILLKLPTVELDSIAVGVADKRIVRGVVLDIDGTEHIIVEADTGVFYKASRISTGDYTFSRTLSQDDISNYLRVSEQYRLVAERPFILRDRENIARLLFNLEKDTPEFKQQFNAQEVSTYDEYVQYCAAQQKDNELYGYAENLLTGESMQQRYVQLAKASIPDFKKLGERTIIGKQHNLDVLNKLLPLQSREAGWVPLTLDDLALPETAERISRHIQGTNFAYAMVETSQGERSVYYSFSGGKKASKLKFKLQTSEQPTQVIDGVTYIDAGMRMKGRAPDLDFTSLPVLRDAEHLSVREITRTLDSERLVATILKEDLKDVALRDIHFFTLMDTCRSCGGVILPQTRLMFSDVNFSVSYLMDYSKT